ncbi:MAG: hemerythrin domain-containing protein [Methyloligellaceae bacterium]
MTKTMTIIRSEHSSIAFLLGLLERQTELIEKTGQPDLQLVTEITDYFRSFPDLYHHPKEDLVLRRLRKRAAGLDTQIDELEADHHKLSNQLHEFSRTVVALLVDPSPMTRANFLQAARSFIEREREHMAIEERFFFPAAEKWLTDKDWMEIDEAVGQFVDPLSAPDAGHRFFALRGYLDRWQANNAA